MNTYAEVLGILAFFGSFWLSVTTITVTALTYRYWRRKRTLDHGSEIVRDMLQRKMTADEIERVLVAWSGDSALAKKLIDRKNASQ